jgi:hypothetical protein
MHTVLDSPFKKLLAAAIVLGVAGSYLALATRTFLASHFAAKSTERGLQLGSRLVPENADYHDQLGRLLHDRAPQQALKQYELAIHFNPHNGNYWRDLAALQDILSNTEGQIFAMDRAVQADPRNPDIAWDAANIFLASGDVARALREFRVVLEGAPNKAYPALQLCLHAADVDAILAKTLPPQPAAYLAFLDLLTTQNDSIGAARTWGALIQLGRPLDAERALQYINYLILHHDVAQARVVWNQTLELDGLSSHLAGRDNLVVNPTFESAILNGGFDWRYRRHANVELALDPSDFHAGHRSLSASFDGPGISDAGIFQLIPVDPDTEYQFSAYFKSDNMDGAGGPRLAIEDAYSGASYFQSEDLKNSEVWREVSGEFKTPTGAQLVVLHLVRVPNDSPIRGKLWIDNFRLVEK